MAPAPLLQLTGIALTYGGNPLFRDLDLVIQPGDRLALVGRNGSGKSTLMKIMAGLVQADGGSRILTPGTTVGYMEQEPDFAGYATLGDYAMGRLDPAEAYRVEIAAEGLGFDPAVAVETASGGERRRAALARLLAEAPELMLLDEPTNHLDIQAIQWLEGRLRETRAGFVLISHDRAFLNALSRAMLWVDRGQARRLDQSFAAFEDWRDKTWADEDEARHKLDRKIKHEAKWAVEGISARRKRNMGRVRALQALKSERASQIRRQGTAALALDAGPQSGKLVAEADRITKSFDGVAIVKDFSLKVLRGDRVALVGPNGAGKTTVLKLLTGAMAPDSGLVRLGTNLDMAVFDQARAQLNPDASLWENLTGDPTMRVSGQADQVMVRGQPKHVVGYLKDFLFDEQQARAPVRSLSGGERARLLLARIMARDSNLLVLDEPTNDLDVETLDLLQDLLGEYPGTVLLVSHDRDFIDRVATTTLVFEGQGRVTAYAGGWTDMLAQRGAGVPAKPGTKPAAAAAPLAKPAPRAEPAPKPSGLSFTEKKRLDSLPSEIARLEAEIAKLSDLLSDADLYTREPVKAAKAADMLEQRQTALSRAEEEWLDLAERDQG
ncbi:MAG: ATP-binding cassette domain-containing protein [Rhodobacter sp.]|uniref:ABC-F family ATP-binding cassette domain-containing protein n=1 Tax=Pararhodobacter sp. TaxID=2127056 RepID=UPI002CE4E308|nr:ATP-binding cassette domain-containing protein [Pararhodobacter sp.]MCC0073907.1 ATP-binding cassette domain-containing protein [Rhodobacter sp.]HPD92822.1 ATP-binding cassette domain-containing protein [Pararhodobacter sp.]